MAYNDPEDQYASERERLMRFYSEFDPANATALVNAELGRRKAEQMFADARSKIPMVSETAPKSELGRRVQSLVNVGGLYSSTPEEQAKIRQGKILDLAKGQVQSSTLEAGAKNLTPEQYANQKAQNLSAYDFLTRVQQGRAMPSGTSAAPAYGDVQPSNDSVEGWGRKVAGPSAATNSMDALDVAPQDFDTWGRKVAGPSAATNSMDAPANAVGFAKRVLAANQQNRPAPAAAAAPAAAPAQGGNFFTNLFKGGPEVQSNNQAVIQRQQGPMQPGQERAMTRLNVGNSSGPEGSAADFFRADKARQELEKSGEAFTTMKRGGAAQAFGKDAALHKALEIIHHMLTRGH